MHPPSPPNASPRGVPKCYTRPGIDTSLTRAGSKRRQKAIVRTFVVMTTCGGQAAPLDSPVKADQACGIRSSGPKENPRVESDAGRTRCKLQESAHEEMIGATRARQPLSARCGERVTVLTPHRQAPSCHRCPFIQALGSLPEQHLNKLHVFQPLNIFTFMPSFGPACVSPHIAQRLTSYLRSICSS